MESDLRAMSSILATCRAASAPPNKLLTANRRAEHQIPRADHYSKFRQ
jgi:hypothetical protein